MKIKRLFVLVAMFVGISVFTTGCVKPYDKPEYITLEANQTGFLVPLVGDTENQASFESEELLAQAKVATKEIQIPHRWVQTGRGSWNGEWRPSAKLIVVERKPVTREWASATSDDNKNKAIFAESKESIGIYVGMNCSAQINEEDATKFLYRYNNKPLSKIIDTDIRAMVEKVFNDECNRYGIEDIKVKKTEIINVITETVTNYFKEYGITITVLGMKEGISYENPEIQVAIDEKASSLQKIETQKNLNEVALAQAQAQAEAEIIAAQSKAETVRIAAEAEAEANKKIAESLTPELIEMMKYEKWNGDVAMVQGANSMIVDIGNIMETE
jgi:regulator of protease activity HflC (stomatin/prohibitin superfamily)